MGRKALKRKMGKKVIDGTVTLPAALARLEHADRAERAARARRVSKSAGSSLATAAPVYQPGREAEFMRSAFQPYPQAAPTVIQKAQANQAARAEREYQDALKPMRAMIAKAMAPLAQPEAPPAPAVVKQLTRLQCAELAELQHRYALAAANPTEREQIRNQITRISDLILV